MLYPINMLTEDAKVAAFLRQCKLSGFSREKMQLIKEGLDPTLSIGWSHHHADIIKPIKHTVLKPYIKLDCEKLSIAIKMLQHGSHWRLIKLVLSDKIHNDVRFTISAALKSYPHLEMYIEYLANEGILSKGKNSDEVLVMICSVRDFMAENPNTEFQSGQQLQAIAELWK